MAFSTIISIVSSIEVKVDAVLEALRALKSAGPELQAFERVYETHTNQLRRELTEQRAETDRVRNELCIANSDLDRERKSRTIQWERAERLQSEISRSAADLAELKRFRAREAAVPELENALKRWSNVTTADELVRLHKAVDAFRAFKVTED